jgi:hypothetical protein
MLSEDLRLKPGVAEHLQAGWSTVEDTTSYHEGAHAQIDDPATEEDAS